MPAAQISTLLCNRDLDRLASKGGASTEFCDFRDYSPGDDVRFVDWNIFARINRPYLKQFHHEKEMHVALHVAEWALDESAVSFSNGTLAPLKKLRITATPEFRKRVFAAVVGYNGRYREMDVSGDSLTLKPGGAWLEAEGFLGEHNYYDYGSSYGGYYGDKASVIAELRGLHRFLIGFANSESVPLKKHLSKRPRDDAHAHLFLYAEAPPGFAMKNGLFDSGTGLVLYVMDIFKP